MIISGRPLTPQVITLSLSCVCVCLSITETSHVCVCVSTQWTQQTLQPPKEHTVIYSLSCALPITVSPFYLFHFLFLSWPSHPFCFLSLSVPTFIPLSFQFSLSFQSPLVGRSVPTVPGSVGSVPVCVCVCWGYRGERLEVKAEVRWASEWEGRMLCQLATDQTTNTPNLSGYY